MCVPARCCCVAVLCPYGWPARCDSAANGQCDGPTCASGACTHRRRGMAGDSAGISCPKGGGQSVDGAAPQQIHSVVARDLHAHRARWRVHMSSTQRVRRRAGAGGAPGCIPASHVVPGCCAPRSHRGGSVDFTGAAPGVPAGGISVGWFCCSAAAVWAVGVDR